MGGELRQLCSNPSTPCWESVKRCVLEHSIETSCVGSRIWQGKVHKKSSQRIVHELSGLLKTLKHF